MPVEDWAVIEEYNLVCNQVLPCGDYRDLYTNEEEDICLYFSVDFRECGRCFLELMNIYHYPKLVSLTNEEKNEWLINIRQFKLLLFNRAGEFSPDFIYGEKSKAEIEDEENNFRIMAYEQLKKENAFYD